MWQPKCHRSVQANWISKCRHWLPVGDAKVTETKQNWINYNQSVSECRVHQMCRIQMPTETNDFAHQDSTHKLGKMGKLNCKHAAFCLGFVYSEGSRMWRGAQIPSFMRFCLCLALRSLHAQPYTSFEHIRIWGPMESHMWPCCGLSNRSNLCKGVTWEGGNEHQLSSGGVKEDWSSSHIPLSFQSPLDHPQLANIPHNTLQIGAINSLVSDTVARSFTRTPSCHL